MGVRTPPYALFTCAHAHTQAARRARSGSSSWGEERPGPHPPTHPPTHTHSPPTQRLPASPQTAPAAGSGAAPSPCTAPQRGAPVTHTRTQVERENWVGERWAGRWGGGSGATVAGRGRGAGGGSACSPLNRHLPAWSGGRGLPPGAAAAPPRPPGSYPRWWVLHARTGNGVWGEGAGVGGCCQAAPGRAQGWRGWVGGAKARGGGGAAARLTVERQAAPPVQHAGQAQALGLPGVEAGEAALAARTVARGVSGGWVTASTAVADVGRQAGRQAGV